MVLVASAVLPRKPAVPVATQEMQGTPVAAARLHCLLKTHYSFSV
jgi:hypothetical protein